MIKEIATAVTLYHDILLICVGANAGLKWARDELEHIKAKYPTISYADLYQLASVVGIEFSGGPIIPFR